MYDAIVVGLGPAGSTAAYTLASAGLKVLAIDKERFPRYKSCGGCISTKIERILDFDISGVVEHTVYGATFTYKSERVIDIISDRPLGYNVMRDTFDEYLVTMARESGAEIIEGLRINGFIDNGDHVTVRGENGEVFKAMFLLGADGASGILGRKHFGLDPRQCAVSVTAEVPYDSRALNVDRKLFIDFGGVPYGYSWIFPKKKVLSVGIAGDPVKTGGKIKDYFKSFVRTHPALKGLDIGKKDGWTVPIHYSGASSVVKGRVLLIGDTGHLVDPFLGEGIYYAVRTAKAAASSVIKCLRSKTPELGSYEDWLRKDLYPEFESAGRLSDLVYNHPRLWYSIIEKDPEIMQRYYNVIRGEEDSSSFYTWVYGKVRSKPWKVLRRWIESRFLPA